MGVLSWLFGGKQKQHPVSDAEPQSEIDWLHSDRHLKLLGCFLYPSDPAQSVPAYWDKILGQPRQSIIAHLRQGGMLVAPKTVDALSYAFTVAELKALLKERSLPVSGKKDLLVERLLSNDPQGMERRITEHGFLQCSPEAKEAVAKFNERCRQEKAVAEAQSLACLHSLDFQKASAVVAAYEAKQIFQRGVGFDWSNASTVTMMCSDLASIFSSRPGILSSLSDKDLDMARVAAGMMHLWGVNRAKDVFAEGFVGLAHMEPDTVARMLLFHAHYQRDLRSFKEVQAKTATVVAVSDSHTCDECKKIAGESYAIGKLPELPYPKCSCSLGCRCTARANF